MSGPVTRTAPPSTAGTARTARVPLQHRRTLFVRFLEVYSRRAYGAVLEPGLVALHNPRVLRTMIAHENRVARWRSVDPTHQALATMAAAVAVGCSWCVDFGYWHSRHADVPAAKLDHVPDWRHAAEVYTDSERAVLGYAEAVTATPPEVTDAMVEQLRTWFDDGQIVELTALVALENSRSRTNAAMGLTGQGFRDQCDLPPR